MSTRWHNTGERMCIVGTNLALLMMNRIILLEVFSHFCLLVSLNLFWGRSLLLLPLLLDARVGSTAHITLFSLHQSLGHHEEPLTRSERQIIFGSMAS
jgi:hypothetical protein